MPIENAAEEAGGERPAGSDGDEHRRRRRRHRRSHRASLAAPEPAPSLPGEGGEHRHRRRRHGSGRHHRRERSDRLFRAAYFTAACLLAATAVVLNLHDASLRRPDTDDGPGDPPTMFLFFALVAALLAGFCMVRLVLLIRQRGRN